jgi:hypothetical protein
MADPTELVTPPEPGTPADPPTAEPAVPATLPDDHPLVKAYAETKRRLKEREDKEKSEAQRLADDLTAEQAARQAVEAKVLRFEVAQAKGISPENIDLLHGSTRDEMEKVADRIAEMQAQSSGPRPPAPNPTQGGGGEPVVGTPAEQFAGFLKSQLGH